MRWGRGSTEAARTTERAPDELSTGERVLATARLSSGGWVVGTPQALHIGDASARTSLGWEHIDGASWDQDEQVLTLRLLAIDGEPARTYPLALADPGRLPELVRDRVMSSILLSRHVELIRGRGARVVVRRRPDDAELDWSVAYDKGVDGADPEVAARLAERLAEIRAVLGI